MNVQQIAKQIIPVGTRRVVKDLMQLAVYATPAFHAVQVALSSRAQAWFDILSRDGMVRIEGEPEFERIANYLESTYFHKIEESHGQLLGGQKPVFPFGDSSRFIQDLNKSPLKNAGTEINCSISFADAACSALFFNEDLASILYKYYGRQPYYRNQPLIQKVATNSGINPEAPPLTNGNFHVDHLRQVSFMLLVSDVTERDTHMQYCIGSHKRNLLREGIEMSFDECKAKLNDYSIVKCTGKKGTLFVFDTSGIHRGTYMPDSVRKILHLNITTGHHRDGFIDHKKSVAIPDSLPEHVKRMFSYLN